MISLDTETTGTDLHHGAIPFFVTTCSDEGEQRYWEWEVDPLTREIDIPEGDLDDVYATLNSNRSYVVLQNAKFDVAALKAIHRDNITGRGSNFVWCWETTHDTLLAGHLLASNQAHDLTSMAMMYLGVDIEPYEKRLKDACNEARRYCRTKLPEWKIAKEGLEGMPSAKATVWKYDTWLPRALLRYWNEHDLIDARQAEEYNWDTVLSDYANTDSAVTIQLWKAMEQELHRRGLWEIYEERRKILPIVYEMEQTGLTLNRDRLEAKEKEYTEESRKAGRICVNIAESLGYELTLPKSGNNKSLTEFLFGPLGLPATKRSKKTGAPSLDKEVIEHYEATLPERSKQLTFIQALKAKRKRDTALSYMESYQRFWLLLEGVSDDRIKDDVRNDSRNKVRATTNSTSTGLHEGRGGDGRSSLHMPTNGGSSQTGSQYGTPPRAVDSPRASWFILYPSLNTTGSQTLRWSSQNPNEQNISKQEGFNLRYIFGPAPGREWWSLDAKNIELRIPAYESGERELIELFEHPDDPPYYGSTHLLNFATVYPDIWANEVKEVGLDKVGPYCKKKYVATYYQWAKNGGFAIQYGAQEATADRSFHRLGSYKRLKARFNKLEAHNQACIAYATKYGYVETMPDKTVNPKKGYPLLCTRTMDGYILPTIPLNYRTQGTAMWWTMKAMVRCKAKLDEWRAKGFNGRMIIQQHDELVFDFPARNPFSPTGRLIPGAGNLGHVQTLRQLMAKGGEDIGVPTPVGVEYHADNWSEGVTL